MRPSQTILVLEDLQDSFVGPLYRRGVELSSSDRATVIDVYQQWLLLMVDLGYLHHGSLKRDAQRLLSDMVKADVLDLNNAFADLLHLVRCQQHKGFKALCQRISNHLYSLIKGDIAKLEVSDVYAGERLIQLFAYTSRLTLSDIDLTDECLRDYMHTEDIMPSHYAGYLTHFLNKIIKGWVKSFDPERILCGHGPGGVAGHGRVPYETKYKDLSSDTLLNYAFGDPIWVQSPIPSTLDRISHTIFVPKSYKTFRTISMESSTLQYTQQGVLKEIERVVKSSHYLKNRIGTRDQGRNRTLAREGSINRNYATIDLSAASDSVSYALVKKLFRGTKLLRYLIATRSSRTLLPDGRLVQLKKFAPMGSALCFPVETIIFAAVCRFVTREHGFASDFSVYGDDIIVPTQCASDVMSVLEELGFRVNRDKSFYQSDCWFRESCGGEYCDGFDVTPVKVSRKYAHIDRLERMTAYVDSANAAFKKGYRNLRQFYIRKIRTSDYVPRFSPNGLLSDNYTNYHTQRRWEPNLQRIECRVSQLVSQHSEEQDESIRMRHWFESTADRISIGDGFRSNVGRTTVSIKKRWMEKPYEEPDQPFINFFTAETRI
jgi:hypothetical protein